MSIRKSSLLLPRYIQLGWCQCIGRRNAGDDRPALDG